MAEDPIALAEDFLREAVYRSRAGRSATIALRPAPAPGSGACGLGEKAAVALDLSERGREIFGLLFESGVGEDGLGRVHEVTADWVEKQDAIDRRRNHFLKDFRASHGSDRRSYATDVLAAHDAGLADIHREEDAARLSAAERLLACAVRSS